MTKPVNSPTTRQPKAAAKSAPQQVEQPSIKTAKSAPKAAPAKTPRANVAKAVAEAPVAKAKPASKRKTAAPVPEALIAPADGAEIEITIDRLAAGGDGVGRDVAGRVTFVADTAPGDRVRVRLPIAKAKATFVHAELLDVLKPGPSRVEAPCEYFVSRTCGGCQWQHVALEAQQAAKHAIVAFALRRHVTAGMQMKGLIAGSAAFGWRRRARLHADGVGLGFFAPRTHDVVDIAHCAQLEPALSSALSVLRGARPPSGEVSMVVNERGHVAIAVARPWAAGAALIGQGGITQVRTADATYGDAEFAIEDGLSADATQFAQASGAGNLALRDSVAAALGQATDKTKRLVELFAGDGNLSRVALRLGYTVVATDVVDPKKLLPGLKFHAGPIDNVAPSILARPVDVVLLDPPRSGAASSMPHLIASSAKRVVYVSCDPSTLARDIDTLVAGGFRAISATPLDLMPQTAHIEVVAVLER